MNRDSVRAGVQASMQAYRVWSGKPALEGASAVDVTEAAWGRAQRRGQAAAQTGRGCAGRTRAGGFTSAFAQHGHAPPCVDRCGSAA